MGGYETILLLIAWGLAGGSPGPATLTISGTAMARGRAAGVAAGAGVLAGSAAWGLASALGTGAIMLANAWIFVTLKYVGAAYLLWLAFKSMRSAMNPGVPEGKGALRGGLGGVFVKGLLIHLTNPKAILSWGAIFAIALPAESGPGAILLLYGQLLAVSTIVFIGYGVLFSNRWIVAGYTRARRLFEVAFALLFGVASLKILTTKVALQ